jgi:sulfur-carrier protein
MTRLLFLGRLRERIGMSEKDVLLPPEVKSGNDLIAWLSRDDAELAEALGDHTIRLAVDLTLTGRAESIEGAGEIAFLPPMSGG